MAYILVQITQDMQNSWNDKNSMHERCDLDQHCFIFCNTGLDGWAPQPGRKELSQLIKKLHEINRELEERQYLP